MTTRRYDIDWIRVIAIGLLLIYHIAIGFQPWGAMIGFIPNKQPWESLWIPMSMLNVWRIPLLFFVSGMGVYFAMQKRNWGQLLKERTGRILLPFIFGIFFIVPLHVYLLQYHYKLGLSYTYDPGHVWFLGHIFIYVLVLSPVFFYLKKHDEGIAAQVITRVFSHPAGLLIVVAAFVAEAWILKPFPYTLYAMTWHGFFLGLLAFLFGFCFVASGSGFWQMIRKCRWVFLTLAVAFFIYRLMLFQLNAPAYLLAPESICWIVTVFAFGYKYLNRPGRALTYLSQAAYPVYIIHMVFLYLGSLLIFPLGLPVAVKFLLLVVFTTGGCLAFYELVVRRVKILRMVFGLRWKGAAKGDSKATFNASGTVRVI